MKAITILSIAALSIVGSAFAGGPKAPTSIPCAVMGGAVNIAKATASKSYVDYKGRRYFFCCGDCPTAFNANKAKYIKTAKSIPTPKTK